MPARLPRRHGLGNKGAVKVRNKNGSHGCMPCAYLFRTVRSSSASRSRPRLTLTRYIHSRRSESHPRIPLHHCGPETHFCRRSRDSYRKYGTAASIGLNSWLTQFFSGTSGEMGGTLSDLFELLFSAGARHVLELGTLGRVARAQRRFRYPPGRCRHGNNHHHVRYSSPDVGPLGSAWLHREYIRAHHPLNSRPIPLTLTDSLCDTNSTSVKTAELLKIFDDVRSLGLH